MKKSLSDWASIAEIISGFAVVATLIFLIFGIRGNTEITRVAVYESNINSLIEWRSQLIQDRDIARLWEAYTNADIENLDSTDRLRLVQLVANNFNIYEKAYYAQLYGVMGTSESARFEAMSCVQYGNALQNEWMLNILDRIMTTQFMSYLSDNCADGLIPFPEI